MSLLTVHELAQALKVAVSTIYYWSSRREIPYVKLGRHLRFDLDAVHEWFQKKTESEQSCASPTFDVLMPRLKEQRSLTTCNVNSARSP